ncbi:hypothetical protein DYU11_28540 [Fibrisoma montanum]|uniref:Uncharacterized protein n=1 Tax=Fibrisoma montanum TaxID=2305895 RepID=A0A418LYS5_9BACT|nr:hypothetical protein [Fibrisoma montanum]RIV18523.1 hypothetical protein DYU11_28540 [Fibrisoma montanum]
MLRRNWLSAVTGRSNHTRRASSASLRCNSDTIIIRQGWDHDVTITKSLSFNLQQLIAQAEDDKT